MCPGRVSSRGPQGCKTEAPPHEPVHCSTVILLFRGFAALLSSFLSKGKEKMAKGEGEDVLKKKKGNEKLENRKVVRKTCTVYAAPLRGHYCNTELRDFRKARDLNSIENSMLLRRHLDYPTRQSCRWLPTFRANIQLPSSGYKSTS